MTTENVEIVGATVAANRTGGREAGLALVHPEFEFTSRLTSVEGAAYRGPDGAGRYYDDLAEAFVEWHNEITWAEPVASDTVVAGITFRGTARSGVPVELPSVVVFRIAAGKVRRVEAHPDRESALASLKPAG